MYTLRELNKEDIVVINSWRADKNLIDNLGAPFRYINEEVDFKWFENYMANRNSTIRCSILDENNQIVGLVSLTNIDRFNQTAIFHIMIGNPLNRSKGAGRHATQEMLKHAFLDMNLNRIELSVLEDNTKALSLYEKVGFIAEGVKRQATFKNGTFINMVIMSMLKEDYIKGLNS